MSKPAIHLLPMSLGRLAAHADPKKGTARFAVEAVHVEFDRQRFTAAATDTKQLVVVEGECIDGDEFPDVPALLASPNGATQALVPAVAWDKAFRAANRIKFNRYPKVPEAVACVAGDNQTSFAATNGELTQFDQTLNVGGKFPSFKDVFSKNASRLKDGADVDKIAALMADANDAETFDEAARAKKREEAKAVAATTCTKRFAVDPLMLAELLKTLHAIGCDPEHNRVEFEVGHPEGPIIVRAGTATVQVTGLQMPLIG